jgi:hypothetical protein
MSQLILIDQGTGQEIGRQTMDASERLFFYRAWDTHDLIRFDSKRYRIHTVAWQVPQEDLVLCVSFDSWAPYCDE